MDTGECCFLVFCGLALLSALIYIGVCFFMYPVYVPACRYKSDRRRCECNGSTGRYCLNTQVVCQDKSVAYKVLVESNKPDDFVSYQINNAALEGLTPEERTLSFDFSSDYVFKACRGYVSKFYLNSNASELYLEVELPSVGRLLFFDDCILSYHNCKSLLETDRNDHFALHFSQHTGYVFVVVERDITPMNEDNTIYQKGWVRNYVYNIDYITPIKKCSGTCTFTVDDQKNYTLVVDNLGYNIKETTNYSIGPSVFNDDLGWKLLYGGAGILGIILLILGVYCGMCSDCGNGYNSTGPKLEETQRLWNEERKSETAEKEERIRYLEKRRFEIVDLEYKEGEVKLIDEEIESLRNGDQFCSVQ